MPLSLDPWQKEALSYDGDLLMCTGRRVGKSYILARKAVEYVVKKRKPAIIVSLTEDQAMVILIFALNYAREAYPRLIGKGMYKPKLKELTLIVRGKPISIRIRPVGATGDAVRSFEAGFLGVDEASRMPVLFWLAATPILLTAGADIQMCLASTPFGRQGYFWKHFNEAVNLKKEDARFKVIYVTTPDVIDNRKITRTWTEAQKLGALNYLKQEEKDQTRLQFGQEYLGLFLEDLRQFFPDETIKKCMTLKEKDKLDIKGADLFMGVDVARLGEDQTVLLSLARFARKNLKMYSLEIASKIRITETIKRIYNADSRNRHNLIYIDTGGVGGGVYDGLLAIEDIRWRIVSINNASKSLNVDETQKNRILKEDLYMNLLRLMESGKIELFDDPDIEVSLKSVQYEYVSVEAGKPHIKIFGNYTHITEALIRAAWCMQDKSIEPWIR